VLKRKSTVLLVAMLIVLVAGVSACSSREPGRYYNDDKDFSLKFPDGWEAKEGLIGTTVMGFSPMENASDSFRENVNVVVEELPQPMSLESYTSLNLGNMQKLLTDFQILDRGQTTINETDAKWFVYSQRTGSIRSKILQYFMVKDKRGYVVTGGAAPDTFSQYRPEFEKIAQTFRFE